MPKTPTMFRLDNAMRAKLKAKADREGRTMTDVVKEFIARGLRKEAAEVAKTAD